MKKVDVIGEFDTAFGKTLVIERTNDPIQIGDTVADKNNKTYVVKNVVMPTRPDKELISLVV